MENFSRKVGSFVHVDVHACCIIQGLLSPIKGILMQFLKSSLPPQGMDNMGLGKKKYKSMLFMMVGRVHSVKEFIFCGSKYLWLLTKLEWKKLCKNSSNLKM